MKAFAILHQLIPVIRGLEKKKFFRLHCYSWSFSLLVLWSQQPHATVRGWPY